MAPGSWISYTPALTAVTTDPTLGSSSTQFGHYMMIGKTVFARFIIQFGSGPTAGTGAYRVGLPVTASANYVTGTLNNRFQGRADIFDASAVAHGFVDIRVIASTATAALEWTSAFPTGTLTQAGAAAPWTWAANDLITGQVIYEAA